MFIKKKKFSSAIKHFLLFSFCILSITSAYNLNTDEAIVFSDPYKRPKNRGSYFGYSVALYSGPYNSNPSVLVGAPRANITQLKLLEPGSVFKCSLDGDCKEWILDDTKNGNIRHLQYGTQIRDNSWLGGSISVENKDNPRVLVCAPRWKMKFFDEWYMTGICYQSLVTSPDVFERSIDQRIESLTDFSHLNTKNAKGESVSDFGMGQLGFSVHTISDEPIWNAMLGSPGTHSWSGAPVMASENRIGIFESIIPPDPYPERRNNEYLGYSVTSGYYFGDNQRAYAAGAPRTNDMKGRVLIFHYDTNKNSIKIKNVVSGTQYGEYFSLSMTSCDVDNNKQDDLIVGAPLWTKNGDEGRIYIFSANKRKFFQLSSWIDGKVVDARFGSSVMCLGDIDQDNYKDVAVGAPYEENHGAVYIFNGHSNGLSEKWSQRITGKQFPYSLQGFGISISEPQDIDGNGYNDIAIGAYKSGHAVLLRTQPVVSVFITISNPEKIKIQSNSSSFFIQICCSYEGVGAPTYLKIIKKFKIDPILERATMENLLLNNRTYDESDTLYFGITLCDKVQILLLRDIKNVIDPIIISASLNLNPSENQDKKFPNTFRSLYPVLNRFRSKTEDSIKIPFAVDCGPDNICHSNITLDVSTNLGNDNRYVIGTSKTVNIFIGVNNYGEAAYHSEVSIIFPNHLALASVPVNCIEDKSNNDNLDVNCALGNPLMKQKKNITLEIDMNQVKSDENQVLIFIKVSTQSESVNPIPLQHNLTIYFDVDADISIAGKSQENLYSFVNNKENNKSIESIRFQHIYEVQKFGATPIQQSTLTVLIPTQLITDKKNKIEIANINETTISRLTLSERLNSYCTQKILNPTEKWNYSNNTNDLVADFPPNERTLYLHCSNPSIICTVLFCILESPLNSSTVAEVKITIDLILRNFDNIMDGKDIIYFVSNSKANITMPKGIIQKTDNKPDFFQVETTFVGSPTASPVATWIIALSVFFGILLLILLTFGLIKLGFFNRKKKEELEALKADEDKKTGFVLETTSSTEILSEDYIR